MDIFTFGTFGRPVKDGKEGKDKVKGYLLMIGKVHCCERLE